MYTHWFFTIGIVGKKSIHAHADVDMYLYMYDCTRTSFRHSTCINFLHGYICIL